MSDNSTAKFEKLRAESIVILNKMLDDLYGLLPPLPDDFHEIQGQMDDDDIIGPSMSTDFFDEPLFTYRYLEYDFDNHPFKRMTILWFDNEFIDKSFKDEIKKTGISYIIEITHEFGDLALYNQDGEYKYFSNFIPEVSGDPEARKSKTLSGDAGLMLVQSVLLNVGEAHAHFLLKSSDQKLDQLEA